MATLEANKRVVRRFIDEIFVKGDVAAVDELVADDFVPYTWPYTGDGKADLKAAMARVAMGLTHPEFIIEDEIAEGDRVVVRLRASATQSGEFMKMPPSGKRYTVEEIHMFRIRDGKIIAHWHQFDQMGLMQQLGALPGR